MTANSTTWDKIKNAIPLTASPASILGGDLNSYVAALQYQGLDVDAIFTELVRIHTDERPAEDFAMDMMLICMFFIEWNNKKAKSLTKMKDGATKTRILGALDAYRIRESARADLKTTPTPARICQIFPHLSIGYTLIAKQLKPNPDAFKAQFPTLVDDVPRGLFAPGLASCIPNRASNATLLSIKTDLTKAIKCLEVMRQSYTRTVDPDAIAALNTVVVTAAYIGRFVDIAREQSVISETDRLTLLDRAGLVVNGLPHPCLAVIAAKWDSGVTHPYVWI